YILAYSRLETHFDDHHGEKTVCFDQWKRHFRLAYHDDEVGKELFLRHSYLSTLLKLILYKEFMNPEEYSRDYFKDLESYFEKRGISLFHYDFFRWVINVQDFCDDYFEKLKIMDFEATDIFRTIYQEMIIAGVRHRLGEYYTPEILCNKMVEKSYSIGDRVLDSSCGSGTFLIEICKKIDAHFTLNTNEKPPKEWFNAINNIFGFDINPIAVLTSKANLILYFKSQERFIEEISINVYLCNSIDPIEFSSTADLELGSYYSFCVDLLEEERELRIPKDALSKTNIEFFQNIINALYRVWESFDNYKDTWEAATRSLETEIKNAFFESNQLVNIEKFFNELYILKQQDKDHIWLYLLNNLVGIRLLLLKKKMDLIITNPPWLTYKDADNRLKENMKKITSKFEIKPDAKNVTNIEEAVVFLFKIPELYLKKDGTGKIAFVMPRSLLVSSQNEKARRFDSFTDIRLFEFDDLIFNIDCCCIFANFTKMKVDKNTVFTKYPIKCEYLDSEKLELIEEFEVKPYVYFESDKKKKYLVKKLIRSEEKQNLLPFKLSDYYNKFIQGADLIPKSLLYCNVVNVIEQGKLSLIDPWISPQAKGVWKKRYYNNVRVETENIFQATLSRKLYPFYIKPFSIFLPLDANYQFKPSKIGPFSRKHWNTIKEIYKKHTNNDLFEVGINYRNKLYTNRTVRRSQREQYKVVFPNAKRLISAVIKDPEGRIYIDSTLYYYGAESEEEAYYICGMLNIPELYKSVKMISDTRHHHKRPLYFNIPKFNRSNDQLKIAGISKSCHDQVNQLVENNEKVKEKEIFDLIEDKLRTIQDLGLKLLKSPDSQDIIKGYMLK
ncbi:MAG: N-6 DNA methylase, partial [Promethearchaeota archaeon]